MIEEGWLAIYMDDMLIFTRDLETHRINLQRVLKRLQENDLFLKPEKCVFEVKSVEFLGLIISADTIAMDPTKIQGIRDWPVPTTVKAIRSFLGFGNFYRRFIPGFSHISQPLNNLTQKDVAWNWTSKCQQAFEQLKQQFISAPVLMMPDVT